MNTLERVVGTINADVFLREFSFSRNQFQPSPGHEIEFADQVVALKDILLLFQVKERTGRGDGDRWFKKKVLGLATKQIRDTLGYLAQHPSITLTNNRGHVFAIHAAELVRRVKLVIYHARSPTELMLKTRHHPSRSAGIIHILQAVDYEKLCGVLATPAEIVEYMDFREDVVSRGLDRLPSEKALVGQFLSGHLDASPNPAFAELVDRFRDARQEWDISGITERFGDRITTQVSGIDHQPAEPTQYYRVLGELAMLTRTELVAFRQRFEMCLAAAKERRFQVPLRMLTSTGCGFLFVAVPPDKANGRLQGLRNLTLGSKYEQRLDRHVGVVLCPEGDEFLIDWIFIEFPWRPDPYLAQMLESSNPFLPLREELIPRYHFDE